MPRYDYQCRKCEAVFEITRSLSDSSDVICTKCLSEDTKKLISIPAITFKGGGFYKTDSSNGNKTTVAPAKIEKKEEFVSKPSVESKPTDASVNLNKKEN